MNKKIIDIKLELLKFLKKNNKNNFNNIKNNTKIFEKNIIDSLGIIDLVFFIENKFKLKLNDKDISLNKLKDINSIEKLIKSKIKWEIS